MHDPIINNNIGSALIVTLGGVLTTLLTIKYKDQIQDRLVRKSSKDRLSLIFDGYEQLIKELQQDLGTLRQTNENQQSKMAKMQLSIDVLYSQLDVARTENNALRGKLGP